MKIVHKCTCGKYVRPRTLPPPKKHEQPYYEFVYAAVFRHGLEGLPEYGKKQRRLVCVTAKKHDWFIPRARGTEHDLVPPPRVYPCSLCEHAMYNRLCVKQNDCVAYAYWATTSMDWSIDARKTIEQKFGKDKRCGVSNAKSSNRSSAKKRAASPVARTSDSRQTTSSMTARRKSSAKSGQHKSEWPKRSKKQSKRKRTS